MADFQLKHPQNKPGTFFVDTSCIDCDACRIIGPDTFSRVQGQSIVSRQPTKNEELIKTLEAVLACPTASIGSSLSWENEKSLDLNQIAASFPQKITDNVFYCGYHSEKSFGAASYFITHPKGNILIDSPRFTGPLVQSLHKLGGIKYHFLTHIDDIADHQKFHKEFSTERMIHQSEITPDMEKFEIILDIKTPFKLLEDVMLIPTPGHTKGHIVLLHQNQTLFTGDHLAWSPRLNHLYAFRNHCWYSWEEQIKSMRSLLDFRFQHILPAHGRRKYQPSNKMQQDLIQCVEWMRSVI